MNLSKFILDTWNCVSLAQLSNIQWTGPKIGARKHRMTLLDECLLIKKTYSPNVLVLCNWTNTDFVSSLKIKRWQKHATKHEQEKFLSVGLEQTHHWIFFGSFDHSSEEYIMWICVLPALSFFFWVCKIYSMTTTPRHYDANLRVGKALTIATMTRVGSCYFIFSVRKPQHLVGPKL